MSWTTPRTWTNVLVDAVDLNEQIRDNANVLKTSIADDGRLAGEVQRFSEALSDLSTSGTAVTFDLSVANNFLVTLTGNVATTTITAPPATGKLGTFVVRTKGDGTARTWTWFTSTVKWSGGAAPTITATLNKYDWFLFMTVDGGVTWAGVIVSQNGDA